jgi:SAM-dependent methyltransferase
MSAVAAVPIAAPSAVRCPGCGTEHKSPPVLLEGRDSLFGAPGRFSVVGCDDCGLAFTQPRLEPEDFATYYPATYSAYVPRARLRARISPGQILDRVRMETIVRRGPYREVWRRGPGRLLDVGCGSGDLGAVFARHGWDVCGVEPSEEAAAHSRARGMDVYQGTLDGAPWQAGTFDAVVFNHSLEHIDDPAEAVTQAAALLRPGGLLAVAVPNFGSWHRRAFGTAWFQLDLPRHLQHFDRDSLGRLAGRAGLRPVAVGAASMLPSLLGSIQYSTFGDLRFGGRGFRIAAWAMLPLVALSDLIGEGDCLHLTAERLVNPS